MNLWGLPYIFLVQQEAPAKFGLAISQKRIVGIGEVKLNWRSCAIDGPGGSGKSTLAGLLAGGLGAKVISMDAFILPATKHRFSTIAKNYDLDRFNIEVIDALLSGRDISYRTMDPLTGKFHPAKNLVAAHERVIIDGIYSLELGFRSAYDFSVFVEAPKEVLMERAIKAKAGSFGASWLDKWLEGEETYLMAQDPKGSATLVLDGSKQFPLATDVLDLVSKRLQNS